MTKHDHLAAQYARVGQRWSLSLDNQRGLDACHDAIVQLLRNETYDPAIDPNGSGFTQQIRNQLLNSYKVKGQPPKRLKEIDCPSCHTLVMEGSACPQCGLGIPRGIEPDCHPPLKVYPNEMIEREGPFEILDRLRGPLAWLKAYLPPQYFKAWVLHHAYGYTWQTIVDEMGFTCSYRSLATNIKEQVTRLLKSRLRIARHTV